MGANHYVKKTCTIYKELGLKDAYANYSVGLSYNYFYAGYLDSAFLVLGRYMLVVLYRDVPEVTKFCECNKVQLEEY